MSIKLPRNYTAQEREHALQLVDQHGLARAAELLGYPKTTISGWCRKRPKDPVITVAPGDSGSENPNGETTPKAVVTKPEAPTPAPKVAKSYTPTLKAAVLEHAEKHGVSSAAETFGVTRFSIYNWKRQVTLHAQGKADDSPVVGSDEDATTLRDQRILQEWKASTGLGPSQVRNQLRRQGFKVSVHTVRCVLEENGYVTPKVRRIPNHDKNYEAVRPNQLWHLDFLHRYIHKQKIYILIILDDFSRFIVGAAIWDGERAAAVMETFSAAVARHGKPEKVLSDGGSAFYSWKGLGRFTELLTELEVDQVVAQYPETNGKLEVLNANVQKELFNQEKFFDLGETQRRFLAWVGFYNFRRTHHALGGLLVPADRYFGRADEVLACIEAGKPLSGVGEPAAIGERQLDLFRISSCHGKVEVHLLGHRMLLPSAG